MSIIQQIRKPISLIDPNIVLENGRVVYGTDVTGVNTISHKVGNGVSTYSQLTELVGNNGAISTTLSRTAGAIAGSDPNFYIDLSAAGLPAFPASLSVYVSNTGFSSDYVPISPVNYNPITGILSGMNSPVDFPDQVVMVVYI